MGLKRDDGVASRTLAMESTNQSPYICNGMYRLKTFGSLSLNDKCNRAAAFVAQR